MLVADLERVLDGLAPAYLSQPGDNSGVLVGDLRSPVRRVLAALELTGPVLEEAKAGGYDTILTHHPVLFAPVRSLVESRGKESLLRRSVTADLTVLACHTNLDAAEGGLAEIAGAALELRDMTPLEMAASGWWKLVGFVPEEAVEEVAAAVFAAGAGGIGRYSDCAFATEGTGWFTPGSGSNPAVGMESSPERTPEVRWETVVPRQRVGAAVRAFVDAHPYEEPAFDLYPVEDLLPRLGLGRVGRLAAPISLEALARRVGEVTGVGAISWCGAADTPVSQVGVVPGSGRNLLEAAMGRCDVLVTGDLGYHDAERALEAGLCLVDVPHGDFEWWAFRRWTQNVLAPVLLQSEVTVALSEKWSPPWKQAGAGGCSSEGREAGGMDGDTAKEPAHERLCLWIDGGSRGNPGPSAIGVVMEDADGTVLHEVGRAIGTATNNVAEYQALLVGLELAAKAGARDVDVRSDSELLVRQMTGEYKVKNEGLKPLHAEARDRARGFRSFVISHVERTQNARADALVNRALDEHERAGL